LNPVDREILLSPAVLSSTMRLRLFGRYGSQTPNLVEAARPGEFESVEGSAATWAELRWAARSEGALHLDDLLLRRVRLGILLPEGGLKIMDQIRSIVQPEMNWDDPTWQSELSQYTRLWHDSYSIS
jgi:glycerol-3-phosphate dehydrogenase